MRKYSSHKNTAIVYSATKQILKFYSAPQQLNVLKNLTHESRSLKVYCAIYKALKKIGAEPFAALIYAVRVAAQFKANGKCAPVSLVCFATTPNQKKGIEHVGSFLNQDIPHNYFPKQVNRKRHLKSFLKLIARLRYKEQRIRFYKTFRILKLIGRRYEGLTLMNVALYYIHIEVFSNCLVSSNKACIIANDFHPVPLAFRTVAEINDKKILFTMHGQISSENSGIIFPPLNNDINFLYGEAALKAYEVNKKAVGKVFFTGSPVKSSEIRPVPKNIKTIGVCLSHYFDQQTDVTIKKLANIYPKANILIRYHPRAERKKEYAKHRNINVSYDPDIVAYATNCDLVIVGNSSVVMDLLKIGCPVAYMDGLDNLGYDDVGMLKNNTVLEQFDRPLTASEINDFFGEAWVSRFRHYDALYLVSDDTIKNIQKEIQTSYSELLQE